MVRFLYRIVYPEFDKEPFLWGFCYTAYNALTDKSFRRSGSSGQAKPQKGLRRLPIFTA